MARKTHTDPNSAKTDSRARSKETSRQSGQKLSGRAHPTGVCDQPRGAKPGNSHPSVQKNSGQAEFDGSISANSKNATTATEDTWSGNVETVSSFRANPSPPQESASQVLVRDSHQHQSMGTCPESRADLDAKAQIVTGDHGSANSRNNMNNNTNINNLEQAAVKAWLSATEVKQELQSAAGLALTSCFQVAINQSSSNSQFVKNEDIRFNPVEGAPDSCSSVPANHQVPLNRSNASSQQPVGNGDIQFNTLETRRVSSCSPVPSTVSLKDSDEVLSQPLHHHHLQQNHQSLEHLHRLEHTHPSLVGYPQPSSHPPHLEPLVPATSRPLDSDGHHLGTTPISYGYPNHLSPWQLDTTRLASYPWRKEIQPGDSSLFLYNHAADAGQCLVSESESSSWSPRQLHSVAVSVRRRRRRVQTAVQRTAANMRERRRMCHLNVAFDRLKECLPSIRNKQRLSRIQTLKAAIDYIQLLRDSLSLC